MVKKRSISASEYIDLMQNRIETLHELFNQRICIFDDNFYLIFDYYPQI